MLGATGQIGRAAVRALTADGWEVTAASRGGGRDATWDAGVRAVALDRDEEGALEKALGDDCDVLVDMVAFDGAHARQVTKLADRIGSAVVISSGAVYEDARGRSFDTQAEPDGFPCFPVPLPETCGTVAPGDATYGTRKVLLERETLAAGEALPVTLLRAGAVHGPYCRTPRELYFVKRLLDGRRRRVLAYGGGEPLPSAPCLQRGGADPPGRREAGVARAERGGPRGARGRGDRVGDRRGVRARDGDGADRRPGARGACG